MTDWATAAALIGSLAAVATAFNTARALNRAATNLREQLRPIVVVELRRHPYARGVQEIVVTNYGQQPARDLTVTFVPELQDPHPDATEITTTMGTLVRRFARTFTVLSPRGEIVHVWHDFGVVPGAATFMHDAPTPEHAEATVVYFGPDGTRYEDDFELDVHLVGLSTTINMKDSPSAQRSAVVESLSSISQALRSRPWRSTQNDD